MDFSDKDFVKNEKRFLTALIPFNLPVRELDKLDKYGWKDWDEEEYLTYLTRANFISVLPRFINDDLSAKDVYYWAEALTIRGTVDEEKGYRNILRHLVMEISSFHTGTDPDLSLIKKLEAQQFIRDLQTAPFDPNDD